MRYLANLIHKAFDLAYREPEAMKNERVIFYHIHNPTPAEMLGVLGPMKTAILFL